MLQKLLRKCFAVLGLAALIVSPTMAADSKIPTDYAKMGGAKIEYTDWEDILKRVVLDTGRSDRRAAPRAKSKTASNIKHGNVSATRLEANRVFLHEIGDSQIDMLIKLRKSLENVAEAAPLSNMTKTEQLAYFLNLRNLAVMIEVAQEYPIKRLDKLVKKDKKGRTAWDRKSMNLAGQMVSIRDLEDHLINNWNDPLVMYGLYNGAIGGPNIRRDAYTGAKVREQLSENADEFINSLRGISVKGKSAKVSVLYDTGKRYFPDFNKDIKNHLIQYAKGSLRSQLRGASKFKASAKDWYVADLMGGSAYKGSTYNDNAGAVGLFMFAVNDSGALRAEEGFGGGSGTAGTDSGASGIGGVAIPVWYPTGMADKFNLPTTYPPHVQEYLNRIYERNARMNKNRGTVTITQERLKGKPSKTEDKSE